jgi:SagB-type dehydrogenase family enzyme
MISLPVPKYKGELSLEESILGRRSIRNFHPHDLTFEQLSQILWAGQGITDAKYDLRSAPSAGALYPIEIFVIREEAVYKYIPEKHSLDSVLKGDKRAEVSRASLGQQFISEAPVNLIIAGNFEKTREKYGARADRYVYMEAGHVAENICLQVVALGLGSVVVGAFWDNVIASILDLPYEIEPIYIIPIGYVKQK